MKTSSSMAANTRDLPGTSSPVSPPSPWHSWVSFSPSSSLPKQKKGVVSQSTILYPKHFWFHLSEGMQIEMNMFAPDPCGIWFAEDVPVQP